MKGAEQGKGEHALVGDRVRKACQCACTGVGGMDALAGSSWRSSGRDGGQGRGTRGRRERGLGIGGARTGKEERGEKAESEPVVLSMKMMRNDPCQHPLTTLSMMSYVAPFGHAGLGCGSGTQTSFPTLATHTTHRSWLLIVSGALPATDRVYVYNAPWAHPLLQLPAHDLVQRVCKVPDVVAVQPCHGDPPIPRQVDVRLLHQRLALCRPNPREAASQNRQAHVSTSSHTRSPPASAAQTRSACQSLRPRQPARHRAPSATLQPSSTSHPTRSRLLSARLHARQMAHRPSLLQSPGRILAVCRVLATPPTITLA